MGYYGKIILPQISEGSDYLKARLIQHDDALSLLLCTGKIKLLTTKEAFEFISTFDDPSHYAGRGKWMDKIVKMEDYEGRTIAVVEDNGFLRVEDAPIFRSLLASGPEKHEEQVELLTIEEYATQHKKSVTLVRRLCREGRLEGAIQKGKVWLVPAGSPYPADERMKDGRRWGKSN